MQVNQADRIECPKEKHIKIKRFLWDVFSCGLPEGYDLETLRKIFTVNLLIIFGGFILIVLGAIEFILKDYKLAGVNLSFTLLLLCFFVYLRKTKNHYFVSLTGNAMAGIFYSFLIAYGGIGNTAYVWSFTYPLISVFLLGIRKGTYFSLMLLLIACSVFIFSTKVDFLASYDPYLILRFIPAYVTIYLFTLVTEKVREIVQRRLETAKFEIEKNVLELGKANESLRESEEKYRTFFKTSQDCVFITSIDGRVLDVNDAAVEFFGYDSKEDLWGIKVSDIYADSKDREAFIKFNRQQGFSKEYPVNLRKTDGSVIHALVTTAPKMDKAGNITGFQGTIRDITEQKRALEALKDSEQRFRLLAENITDNIWIFDLGTMRFSYTSPSSINILGYTAEEAIGLQLQDVLTPSSLELATKILNEELLEADRNPDPSKSRTLELEQYHKNGTKVWTEVSVRFIFDQEKRPASMLGVSRNITERKKYEEALRKSEEKYRSFVQNFQGIAYKATLKTWLPVFFHGAVEEITGYTEDEFLAGSPHWFELIFPDDLKHLSGKEEVRCMPNYLLEREYRIIRKDEKIRWVHEFCCNICDASGKPVELEGTITDITFRKQAQEEKAKLEGQYRQAQKLEAIGTLAGGIAHDFNNIIGIILGNTELAMLDVPEWSPARKNLETACNACFRARDVVRQILSFSRQTDQDRSPVILGPVIKESIKLLRSSIPSTIEIRQHIPETTATILADPVQIHQVIINLCTNAAHAMKERGGVIEVSLTETTMDKSSTQEYSGLSPGQYVELSIRDTGQGIAPEIIDRIFDPYFTTKKIGEGSGIGLAVVHGIVKNHGGAIAVFSEPGKGTFFRILFPKIDTRIEPEKETAEAAPQGKEKILYVDDEISLAEIGQQVLEHLGYQVKSKTNPVEALEMIRANPCEFDLVITDMTMPQMTGSDLARELIRIRPDIPIILNSGYSDQMDEEKAKEIGIKAYIMKPLNIIQMAKTIRKILDKK